MYVKERDLRINERRQQIDRDYRAWRSAFGKDAHRTAYDLITPVKEFVQDGYVFPVDVPVEQNLADLKLYIDALLQNATSQVAALRSNVSNYLSIEIANTDDFATSRKNALLLDWQENLYILNSAINRRVGSLKDMEADLEETIRMSILQHEVENGVFEQLSCARIENFWLDWRNQCSAMSGDMRDLQEDYNISKNAGKVKSRASRADRALDDLQLMAADHTPGNFYCQSKFSFCCCFLLRLFSSMRFDVVHLLILFNALHSQFLNFQHFFIDFQALLPATAPSTTPRTCRTPILPIVVKTQLMPRPPTPPLVSPRIPLVSRPFLTPFAPKSTANSRTR